MDLKDWHLPRPPSDPLLAALSAAVKRLGLDAGADTLVAGLPLPGDGRLTPGLAVRAAEQLGLRARLVRRAARDIPDAILPAIALLQGREAAVMLKRDAAGVLMLWPSRGDQMDSH